MNHDFDLSKPDIFDWQVHFHQWINLNVSCIWSMNIFVFLFFLKIWYYKEIISQNSIIWFIILKSDSEIRTNCDDNNAKIDRNIIFYEIS